MNSAHNLSDYPISLPLLADDILEFHASRLLLLLYICGKEGSVDSLTKMAKLDFFVRYPEFFASVCQSLNITVQIPANSVEATMIRYHYGPWDQRYYRILAYLEAKHLIKINKSRKANILSLTEQGRNIAVQLEKEPPFWNLVEQMRLVKKILGNRNGSNLKGLIYTLFDKQIASLAIGDKIV